MANGPLDVAGKLNPKHALGASLLQSRELVSNVNMGKGAQSRATVHELEPGIRPGYYGRKGRKGKAR